MALARGIEHGTVFTPSHLEAARKPRVFDLGGVIFRRAYSAVDDVRFGLDMARVAVFHDLKTIKKAQLESRQRGRLSGAITTIFTFNTER